MQFSLRKKALALAAVSCLGSGLLASCSTTSSGGGGGDDAAVPGVTSKTITMGALLSLTGVFAAGAKAQLDGAQLYWDQVNAAGGVCDGRKVEIVARDHGYDAQKTVTAYSDVRDDVLAIQLLTGTPMTQAVEPQMEQDSVSTIPMAFSPDLLGNDSILIPGTTYDIDMVNAVDYLVKEGKLKKGDKIGYVYFQGDFGGAGLKGATYAGKQQGISVAPFQVDPSVTDLSSQMNQMAKDDVKAIFMSVSPPLLANGAALSSTRGLDVPIVVPSPTYVPELLSSPAADQIAKRVIVVGSMNAWSAEAPGVNELRAQYKKSDKKSDPQQFFILGYAAARLMDDALKATCSDGPLTREGLKKAFAGVESFDLNGLGVDLSYTDRSVPPSLSNYIHKADKNAIGGLTPLMSEPFKGENAKPLSNK